MSQALYVHITLILCVLKPTAACFTSAAVWMLYSNENEASPEQGSLQENGLSVLTVSLITSFFIPSNSIHKVLCCITMYCLKLII